MSYAQIDICEAGPPEYPLIRVLTETIFGEYGHRFTIPIEQHLEGRQDVLVLMAYLEGNPVGFKIGYRDRPGTYHSWSGGVLKDYRRQGVAKRLQHWQHLTLKARGYHTVWYRTFNKFNPMLHFGLTSGFNPVGVEVSPENELSIKLSKDLNIPTDRLTDDSDLQAVQHQIDQLEALKIDRPRIEIPATHRSSIIRALNARFQLVGFVHDPQSSQAKVIFERPAAV